MPWRKLVAMNTLHCPIPPDAACASARGVAAYRVAMAALALAAGVLATHAVAQPSHRPGPGRGPGWSGDIHRFPDRDWHVWRGGNWVHAPHDGRMGWWWVAGGLWYLYPAPVYPYPNPYEPPVAPLPEAALPPPTAYWYYCDASQSYYPYVATC